MIRLTAVQYKQTFTSGHSCPCLLEAETLEGDRFEVVVKLRESIAGGVDGLARELVASRFATRLGLSVPAPYLVEITPEFAQSIVVDEVRTRFAQNIGWHFGSSLLTGSWHAVPFTRELPHWIFDTAASVFAFDALVRNDDRHLEKSNYLVRSNSIMLIDHERAFPSPGTVTGPLPWEPDGLSFLARHVFFPGLKGQLPDFEPLLQVFQAMGPDDFRELISSIPDEWDAGGVSLRLQAYLVALFQNFGSLQVALATITR